MWISKKEFNKINKRLADLESEIINLKDHNLIITEDSWYSIIGSEWKETYTLKEVFYLLLNKLNLELGKVEIKTKVKGLVSKKKENK